MPVSCFLFRPALLVSEAGFLPPAPAAFSDRQVSCVPLVGTHLEGLELFPGVRSPVSSWSL